MELFGWMSVWMMAERNSPLMFVKIFAFHVPARVSVETKLVPMKALFHSLIAAIETCSKNRWGLLEICYLLYSSSRDSSWKNICVWAFKALFLFHISEKYISFAFGCIQKVRSPRGGGGLTKSEQKRTGGELSPMRTFAF